MRPKYAEFESDVHFFYFRLEIPFLGKFSPRDQNHLFNMKFDTKTNSNVLNSMMALNFLLHGAIPF